MKKMFSILWRLAISPATFVVLALLWCLDLGLGSVAAYLHDPDFAAKMDAAPFNLWLRTVGPTLLPHSLWVYLLVALTWLMIASLLLCSANWLINRRKRLSGMGEFLVHLGFLLIFSGFVFGAAAGSREQGIMVPLHGETPVHSLGLTLKLQALQEITAENGRVLDTVSQLALFTGETELAQGEVRLNHPLIAGPVVIYPRGAFSRVVSADLIVNGKKAHLQEGEGVALAHGGKVSVRTFLQQNQRMGSVVGPGALLVLQKKATEPAHTLFLSTVAPQPRTIQQGDVTVSLSGFRYRRFGRFDLHRDPGISLVLAGSFLLALGTLWALIGYLANRHR